MLGHGLDFVDPGDVEVDVFRFPDRVGIRARDDAQIGHGVAGMGLRSRTRCGTWWRAPRGRSSRGRHSEEGIPVGPFLAAAGVLRKARRGLKTARRRKRLIAAARFAGAWRLEREIEDRLGGQVLRGEGVARFDGIGPELRYHEELVLTLPGAAAPVAGRNGAICGGSERGAWRCSLTTGFRFDAFVPEGHGAGTDHPCGADLYRVAYDFSRFPGWQAVWTVTGPRKDYTSRTSYRPAP